ncbi:hypothetical protein OUZ56_018366 [Daphnia magna]|uniref:Uncharacterized protein n=1 Tax=Daphnia magna TaxID=35525 RepID=A0ABQ9Z9R8_9CRUS|nr:hypothetical protein OUZ56_018366 [Daphnia magna]
MCLRLSDTVQEPGHDYLKDLSEYPWGRRKAKGQTCKFENMRLPLKPDELLVGGIDGHGNRFKIAFDSSPYILLVSQTVSSSEISLDTEKKAAPLPASVVVAASAAFLVLWPVRLVSTIYSTLADRILYLLHLNLLLHFPRIASFLPKARAPLENGHLLDENLFRKLPTLSDQTLDGGTFLDNRNRSSRKLDGPWDLNGVANIL